MAFIREIVFKGREDDLRLDPSETVAHVSYSDDASGHVVLNIRTHGSKDREKPGALSQKLQFSADAIAQLKRILESF